MGALQQFSSSAVIFGNDDNKKSASTIIQYAQLKIKNNVATVTYMNFALN